MSKRRKNSGPRTSGPRTSAPRRTGTRGAAPREKVRDVFVVRPFEGLADEAEWIALRELVPAATAPLTLAPELAAAHGDPDVLLVSVLPGAAPVIVRPDGQIVLALQRQQQSGDVNRDLACSLLAALETEPGRPVAVPPLPGEGPRLADVIVDGPLDVTVHDGFAFWAGPEGADSPQWAAVLEQANAAAYPTRKLAAASGAYWCQAAARAHVRWVLADDEDAALAALARLAAAGELLLGDDTKFAGMFRVHGRLAPVWDLPHDAPAESWEPAVAALAGRYAAALADDSPLTAEQRRARQGLLGRQLSLR
ncbi:preprotein translocase SecA [Pilimelia terevasa]|uniref:Preprotein translocase SecA n=1 Tax=Pilimelia terevasa TaxID=53372 RepID=A0A8J3FJA6_9ACTN|nr:DUF5926 family protein [Pilimelia terevasa]GGK32891.1 preprotein translocase SecA [Pilimelia terevasa]